MSVSTLIFTRLVLFPRFQDGDEVQSIELIANQATEYDRRQEDDPDRNDIVTFVNARGRR